MPAYTPEHDASYYRQAAGWIKWLIREYPDMPGHRIAKVVGVRQPFVSRVRHGHVHRRIMATQPPPRRPTRKSEPERKPERIILVLRVVVSVEESYV